MFVKDFKILINVPWNLIIGIGISNIEEVMGVYVSLNIIADTVHFLIKLSQTCDI